MHGATIRIEVECYSEIKELQLSKTILVGWTLHQENIMSTVRQQLES